MNFETGLKELNQIGILRICGDLWNEPNSRLFTKSPKTQDKHYSLKLYPKTNSFYDFAGGKGGDIISFVSYIKAITNGQALTFLVEHYRLKSGELDWKNARHRKNEEQEKKAKEQIFQDELTEEIEYLKYWESIYREGIGKAIFTPFSDLWVYTLNELQKVEYKLNILCAADQQAYRRMKGDAEKDLPSDYHQWEEDVEKILKEKELKDGNN